MVRENFDKQFYLAQMDGGIPVGIDPVRHYCVRGWRQGYDPTSWFSSENYLDENPDVRGAEVVPFVHYLTNGSNEGRRPRPSSRLRAASERPPAQIHDWANNIEFREAIKAEFDADWYVRRYPDVASLGLDPFEHYLEYGLLEGRDPNKNFDNYFYSLRHPDVAASGVPGYVHFITAGRLEGRSSALRLDELADPWFAQINQPLRAIIESREIKSIDALYIVPEGMGESRRYRVANVVCAFRQLGRSVVVLPEELAPLAVGNGWEPDCTVVFRCPAWSWTIAELSDYIRGLGKSLAFDVDDLVFSPETLDSIDAYRRLSDAGKHAYLRGVIGYRDQILLSDFVLVPTISLASEVEKLNVPARVLPNTLDRHQMEIWRTQAVRTNSYSKDSVVVAYFSGSKTHQNDFVQCAKALQWLLKCNPNVHLLLVGHLDLGPEWSEFDSRIKRISMLPYLAQSRMFRDVDINIAPLELTPFNDAKSELKLFEAGLAKVPTIASPTSPYATFIRDSRGGLLASNEAEWRAALWKLTTKPGLRSKLGSRARTFALERFSSEAIAREIVRQVLGSGAVPYSDHHAAQVPMPVRFDWIVPGYSPGSGGHRNIFRLVSGLEQRGHTVRLWFTNTEMSANQLKEAINRDFYPFHGHVDRYEGYLPQTDVLVATHWSTAWVARTHERNAKLPVYLVQDYEPSFSPVGSDYLLARETYRWGFHTICSGPWIATKLRRNFGVSADFFHFPIDASTYRLLPDRRVGTEGSKRVLFFARPEMARRCFELGAAVLEELAKLDPEIEVVTYGSDAALSQLSSRFTNLGLLEGRKQLGELYNSATVGLVFSTTNPSLVPFEMMACGLVVADLATGGLAAKYGSDACVLGLPVDPRLAAIDLYLAMKDEAGLDRRRQEGLRLASSHPGEGEIVDIFEKSVLKAFAARSLA
jgi:glycosyltransferase involved in cell wall biosynthesis